MVDSIAAHPAPRHVNSRVGRTEILGADLAGRCPRRGLVDEILGFRVRT